jgi:hypothetical protein
MIEKRSLTARNPMVKVPPDGSLGPAMLACTPGMRAFVIALISTAGTNKGFAAMLAGYGGDGNDNAQAVAGTRLAAHPKVIAAIKEEAEKRMSAGAGLAANVILEIAMDPMHKDRLKAAEMLKNQAGLLIAQKHEHVVEIKDDRSTAEIQRQTLALAERLGVKLPQIESRVIDGEFESVEDSGSLEGLEDIL